MSIRIVTISRQYGSGGRNIGHELAKKLGIKFYDKIFLEEVATELGYTPEYVKNAGEYAQGSAMGFIPITPDTPAIRGDIHLPDDRVVALQNDLVISAADKSPCVIVGRAANYLLRDRSDVLNVFIYADEEYKVARMLKYYGVTSREEALKKMKNRDRQRSKHYRYYTDGKWGDLSEYDIALNTAVLGQNLSVDLLVAAFNQAGDFTDATTSNQKKLYDNE